MDQHRLVVDVASGTCLVQDTDEGVIVTLDGRCELAGRDGPWWRLMLAGDQVREADGEPPVKAPVRRTVELARFADLPADEQAIWRADLAEEGLGAADVDAMVDGAWVERSGRLYR